MQHSTMTYSNYPSQSAPQNTLPTASQVTSQYSSQQGWSPVIDPSPPSLSYSHWPSTAPQTGSPAYHSSSQQPRQQPSYAIHQSPHWGSTSFPDADSPLPSSYRSLSPGYSYSPPENNQASSGTTEAVPPPRGSRRSTPPGSVREHSTASGRASGNPPAGILRCSSCKVTTSPEWRKGPSGKKDLCNACVFHILRVDARFFPPRSRDMAHLVAACGTRGRGRKRKVLQPSDAAKTRLWHWPSENPPRALQCPLFRFPIAIYAAAVMMTLSYRVRLALHQETKLTLNNNNCMALPTLIILRHPHHPLQVPSRILTTTLHHKAPVRAIRGDITLFSQGPSTLLPCLIPPCSPKDRPHCPPSLSS